MFKLRKRSTTSDSPVSIMPSFKTTKSALAILRIPTSHGLRQRQASVSEAAMDIDRQKLHA